MNKYNKFGEHLITYLPIRLSLRLTNNEQVIRDIRIWIEDTMIWYSKEIIEYQENMVMQELETYNDLKELCKYL